MRVGGAAAKGAVVALVCSSLLFSQATKDDREKKKEKPRAKAKTEDRAGDTKLFQLVEIVIDVIEKARDAEVPNMSVVKPELFPMSIGTTVDTALERLAGVDVQRIQEVGTAMDDDSVKVRGLGARRIKILRDGRPLNTSGAAGGYFIDFTMIPLADVDRIEIVRGVGDPRYGNVLGGVINLVTRRPPADRPRTEAQASMASYGTGGIHFFHSFKPGPFEYSLSAGSSWSDGYLRNGNMVQGDVDLRLGYDVFHRAPHGGPLFFPDQKRLRRRQPDPPQPGQPRIRKARRSALRGFRRRVHVRRHGRLSRAGELVEEEKGALQPRL
jgi:outer membrane receptor protein involved in Fe transport